MADLSVEYKNFIDKQILCIKSDLTYGIIKGNGYKVIEIKEKDDKFYAIIINDKKQKIGFGIDTSGHFLGLKESLMKLRELKLKRALGENLDN